VFAQLDFPMLMQLESVLPVLLLPSGIPTPSLVSDALMDSLLIQSNSNVSALPQLLISIQTINALPATTLDTGTLTPRLASTAHLDISLMLPHSPVSALHQAHMLMLTTNVLPAMLPTTGTQLLDHA